MRRREEVNPTTTFWKNITYMNQWNARLYRRRGVRWEGRSGMEGEGLGGEERG